MHFFSLIRKFEIFGKFKKPRGTQDKVISTKLICKLSLKTYKQIYLQKKINLVSTVSLQFFEKRLLH